MVGIDGRNRARGNGYLDGFELGAAVRTKAARDGDRFLLRGVRSRAPGFGARVANRPRAHIRENAVQWAVSSCTVERWSSTPVDCFRLIAQRGDVVNEWGTLRSEGSR